MKRIFIATVAILGMVGGLCAQETVDIKGAWNMSIETPNGEMPLSLQFAASEGEKISGVLSSPQGDLPITGKLTGKSITFAATFSGNNGSISLNFSGTLENDTMTGTADFGGRGGGKWSAKRTK